MTIATQRSTLYRTLLLLGVASLVACGGGGGSTSNNTGSSAAISVANSIANSVGVSSSSIEATGSSASTVSNVSSSLASSIVATSSSSVAVADTTPAVFNFAPTTDAALSTAITSPAITLSGFDVAVPISITNGEYSINGGAFTSAAGTISPAQTLAVKVTSSNANSTAVTTTLTVGGVSATYTVTTLADAIPEAFSFTPATNVAPNSDSTSNAITVSGIEVATAISITGGEYSINGGAFTAAAGTVTNGQTVTVKTVAPATTETTKEVVVTIGGVSGTYSVTTIPDTTPPVAEFKFPTPYTMSEANSLKVRGTAKDDHAITSVKVVVRSFNLDAPEVTLSSEEIEVTPAAEVDGIKDFSSWTATVRLTALAENEVKVIATDDRNNAIQLSDAKKVVIRQADVKSAFPDEMNQFKYIFAGLAIDRHSERNRLLVSELTGGKIIGVDIATGQRTVFSDKPTENHQPFALAIDPISKRLFVSSTGPLYEINILNGAIVNTFDTGLLADYFDIAIETVNGQTNLVFVENVYLAPGKFAKFSLSNNELVILSDQNKTPGLEDVFGLDFDSKNNRYLIASGGQANDLDKHAVIAVDRVSGQHSVLSSNSVGTGPLFSGMLPENNFALLIDVEVDQKRNRALISELPAKVFSVDLTTGNRSIFMDLTYQNVDIGADKNSELYNMKIDEENDVLFGIDSKRKSILEIDLETQEKVIISKSRND